MSQHFAPYLIQCVTVRSASHKHTMSFGGGNTFAPNLCRTVSILMRTKVSAPNPYQARAVNREKASERNVFISPKSSAERELRLYF
jgi:hypothetical protein